jgi:Recombinase
MMLQNDESPVISDRASSASISVHAPSTRVRALAAKAVRRRADERAADVMPTIRELQRSGATSLRAIAAGLNEAGIPTARGCEWSAVQVRNVLVRVQGS